jgi:RHS repeat-associated protein
MQSGLQTGLYPTWLFGFSSRVDSTRAQTPNRQYDPSQGRWLSIDPLSGSPADSQSHNRYTYVADNPTNFSDPLGLVRVPLGIATDDELFFFGLGGGGGLGGGNCGMDGVSVPCELIDAAIRSGVGVQCPGNDCHSISVNWDTGDIRRRTAAPIPTIGILCEGTWENPTKNCQMTTQFYVWITVGKVTDSHPLGNLSLAGSGRWITPTRKTIAAQAKRLPKATPPPTLRPGPNVNYTHEIVEEVTNSSRARFWTALAEFLGQVADALQSLRPTLIIIVNPCPPGSHLDPVLGICVSDFGA